eukprot:GFYU01028585.1.p1 GENE.GFYU01028585.1~~GFYU01028585.1.p1  ORF type:complete len:153 (+),score=37.67 GFYU01028585.1:96-554(+)
MTPLRFVPLLLVAVVLACACQHVAGKTDKSSEYSDMLSWVVNNEGVLNKVHVAIKDGEAVVSADEDIKTGDLLVHIPADMLVWPASIKPDNKYISSSWDVPTALAAFILLEKHNPSSFWRPWLKTLPSNYWNALYFENDVDAALKGSETLGT